MTIVESLSLSPSPLSTSDQHIVVDLHGRLIRANQT